MDDSTEPFVFPSCERARRERDARRQERAIWSRRSIGVAVIGMTAVLADAAMQVVDRQPAQAICDRALIILSISLILWPIVLLLLFYGLVAGHGRCELRQYGTDLVGAGPLPDFYVRPWRYLRVLLYVNPAILAGVDFVHEKWSWMKFDVASVWSLVAAFMLFALLKNDSGASFFE